MKVQEQRTGFLLNGRPEEIAGFVNRLMQSLQECREPGDGEEVIYYVDGPNFKSIGEVTGETIRHFPNAGFEGIKRLDGKADGRITSYSSLGYLSSFKRGYSVRLNGNPDQINRVIQGTLERITAPDSALVVE